MKNFLSVLAFTAILIFSTVAPSRSAEINVVWTSEVGQFAPLWITKEARLFEKYGNSVQLIFIQGASSAAAALSSGDAQVGMFSPQVVISTPALDLVMFGRLGNSMDNRIFARKGIKSLKEVKRVAISRFGSNADFAARYLLQREGLKPDIDVALLQVGNQSNRIVAVETNNADAAMLTPPMTLQARKLGLTLLVDASKLNIPYSSLMFVARRPYLTKNRADLVNFTKAMIEGVAYYKANKEFSLKVLSKYMKVQDREVLEENFREYDFPLKPYPAREYFELPIQEVGKKDPKVLKENPERYADMSLVKEIESSGFIDKIMQEYRVK
ncbi:MAG TPA: ABC transporter substrate-binding protein [Candidatus Binatia bacterium]|jgi:ABC-type nitrate/sulfonate/bicarbonate transport system substrate-binding protein|nr:ABC transporter substrate-binding protein [Candidatus Binatia bacterium]